MFGQPKVNPPPPTTTLQNKTAIVTGAASGLGLETSRQLLTLQCSTLIMACRDISRGEKARETLLNDPAVQIANPHASIKVMHLDMDDYESVRTFARGTREEIPVVDLLVLNAGVALIPNFQPSGTNSQHERTTQVNYLSNVLLVCELLPHLEASTEKTGHKSRITWVGSRVAYDSPLAATGSTTALLKSNESILDFMDDSSRYSVFKTYGNTKLLCLAFFHELVKRLALRSDNNNNSKITINMVCPGMTATNIGQYLPIYLRPVSKVMFMLKARTVEQGAWTIIDAATVVGEESHGKFFGDQKVDP